MVEFTASDMDVLTPLVEGAARNLQDQYAGIMDRGDIAQEIWVYLLQRGREKAKAYIDSNRDDHTRNKFKLYLRNAALKACERERKATLGHDWRDEYNYSRPEVSRLLPLALDPESIPGLSGGGLHDGPSAKSDPAYGGGMLASLIDVRTAFSKLSPEDQRYVRDAVSFDSQWDKLGEFYKIQPNSAYAKWMRILDKMVTKHLKNVSDDAA